MVGALSPALSFFDVLSTLFVGGNSKISEDENSRLI